MSSSYAKQRSTFGQTLASRQGVQWMLADMYVELQLARLMVYKTAWRLDQGEEAREDAYVAKYYADEMAFRTADKCMQIHGGIALTTDMVIEKLWRQQRSFRITEGATEVMKMVIARHVLKTYA
jgi:acyl-CoA dehydrogenase